MRVLFSIQGFRCFGFKDVGLAEKLGMKEQVS